MAGRIIFWILTGLVVLAPLPLGAVHEWAWTLMGCVVGSLLVAWSVTFTIAGRRPSLGLRSTWPFVLPFFVVAGWATIQSLPVAPDSWHHPLWESAATILGIDLESFISLNPTATRDALLRLLTYAGIFWLSLQYCREVKLAQTALYAVAIAGIIYAAYGLIVWFSGPKTVLWFDMSYQWDLSSTFANRNTYASYAGLALIVISSLIFNVVLETLPSLRDRRKWLRRALEVMTERGWVLILGWFVIMTALVLAHSRAGFAGTILGLVLLCVSLGFTLGIKLRHGVGIAAFFLAVGGGIFVLSGEILSERIAGTSFEEAPRFRVYELTLEAINSAPLLGTGYGTFEDVFRFYRAPDLPGFYLQAHNTYLENALELGVPAVITLCGAVVVLLYFQVRGLRNRRRHVTYPCIGLAATTLVASHSLVDFPLQIPAVAATYCYLMGVSCAQSWSSRKEPDPW